MNRDDFLEAYLLGAATMDRGVAKLAALLPQEAFSKHERWTILQAIAKCHADGKKLGTNPTLKAWLERLGIDAKGFGGVVEDLKEKGLKRRRMAAAFEGFKEAYLEETARK